jgi:hypothetical protein
MELRKNNAKNADIRLLVNVLHQLKFTSFDFNH